MFSIDDIDTAVRRILRAKYTLGLFDNPYLYLDKERAERDVFSSEHRAVARRISAESMVLMENTDNLLPLQKRGTIALVGPLADATVNMTGTWSVAAIHFELSIVTSRTGCCRRH